MTKTKFQLEYTINSSQQILFNKLSTPSGLSEWFADDVNIRGKDFAFVWEGVEQKAELTGKKDLKYVRFHWIDDEDEKSFFEFKIDIDELTGDVALIITDFAEENDKEDSIGLWDSQISELKHVLGL